MTGITEAKAAINALIQRETLESSNNVWRDVLENLHHEHFKNYVLDRLNEGL